MESVRPLREVFAELLSDGGARQAYLANPGGFLAGHGYADLPPELVAEAVVSFADAAGPPVAGKLAGFVAAHSGVPAVAADSGDQTPSSLGLELLATMQVDVPAEEAAVGGGYAGPPAAFGDDIGDPGAGGQGDRGAEPGTVDHPAVHQPADLHGADSHFGAGHEGLTTFVEPPLGAGQVYGDTHGDIDAAAVADPYAQLGMADVHQGWGGDRDPGDLDTDDFDGLAPDDTPDVGPSDDPSDA